MKLVKTNNTHKKNGLKNMNRERSKYNETSTKEIIIKTKQT